MVGEIITEMLINYRSTFRILTKQHITTYTAWKYLPWLLKKKKKKIKPITFQFATTSQYQNCSISIPSAWYFVHTYSWINLPLYLLFCSHVLYFPTNMSFASIHFCITFPFSTRISQVWHIWSYLVLSFLVYNETYPRPWQSLKIRFLVSAHPYSC